jgi:hypothetical protein
MRSIIELRGFDQDKNESFVESVAAPHDHHDYALNLFLEKHPKATHIQVLHFYATEEVFEKLIVLNKKEL